MEPVLERAWILRYRLLALRLVRVKVPTLRCHRWAPKLVTVHALAKEHVLVVVLVLGREQGRRVVPVLGREQGRRVVPVLGREPGRLVEQGSAQHLDIQLRTSPLEVQREDWQVLRRVVKRGQELV